MLHRQRTESRRTLVIFDEIHHAGDALSWGEAVREAFEPAARRLALTGTPFRSDTNPIPFVTYGEQLDGSRRSSSDYVYGYANALEDGVVRPVIFLAYSGEMSWRTRAGDEITATLGTPLTKEQVAQAWRTALDPGGEWVAAGAGGRRQAPDRSAPRHARRGRPGHRGRPRGRPGLRRPAAPHHRASVRWWCCPTTRRPAARSGSSPSSEDRWMVAVRMVSEGVDIPRLAVGVYATSVSTAAVLRPGRRPVRPGPPPGRDRLGVPAVGADPAGLRGRAGGRARSRAAPAVGRARGRRLPRGAAPAGHPGRSAELRPSRC